LTESKNTGSVAASEQFDSPETVKKLTFALLDKIFESRPSLLAELKSRAEKEESNAAAGKDCLEAGDLECPIRGGERGMRNVAEECSIWNEECPERRKVDGRKNVLEDSWGQGTYGRNLSCGGSLDERAEMKWNVFDESNIDSRRRATDYSVNSEESGYSSLKDKSVGSGWGKEEEEEERILKIREEEVMLKELVRIAKEEEKTMKMLKKAEEEEYRKVEQAQRAHESILVIEAARKVRQAEVENTEKARKMHIEEKRQKVKDQRARRLEMKKKQTKETKKKTKRERGEEGRSMFHENKAAEEETTGEMERSDSKRGFSRQVWVQPGNMLGIQADESKNDQSLAGGGVEKNTKEVGKRDAAHIAKWDSSGEKSERLKRKKQEEENSATVANNHREGPEEEVEVQSNLFPQKQGARVELVSSSKEEEEYFGENSSVNPEEELPQMGNGIRVMGATGEVSEARSSKFVEKTEGQPGRLLVQVAKCKQCHWATTCKEELQKHVARHYTDNMRWW